MKTDRKALGLRVNSIGFRKNVIAFFFICILFAYGCKEQDKNVEKVLFDIQHKFSKIDTFRADYSTIEDDQYDSYGTVVFIGPSIMRFDDYDYQTGELRAILYSDENYEWSYIPKLRMATKQRLEKKQYDKSIYFAIPSRGIQELKYLGNVERGGKEYFVLEGIVGKEHGENELLEKLKLLVDIETGLTNKIIHYDEEGNEELVQEFSNYEVNIPLCKDDIDLKMPEEVSITELE